jgi:hypothetical protein
MTITIPCKPYVKHFIVINYGDPADLTKCRDLYQDLRKRLSKKALRWQSRKINLSIYSQKIEIIISEDDFYRFGWEMSDTDIRGFNRDIEGRAKFFMRYVISTYEAIMNQKQAIRLFQDRFGYTEDIWSFDSIKKDYFRNHNSEKIRIVDYITAELERKTLEQLSELGTISNSLISSQTSVKNENNQ